MAHLDTEVDLPELTLLTDSQLALFLTFFSDDNEENEFQKDSAHWPNNELDALVDKDSGLLPLVTVVKRCLSPELGLFDQVRAAVLEETKVRFVRLVGVFQQIKTLVGPHAPAKRAKREHSSAVAALELV